MPLCSQDGLSKTEKLTPSPPQTAPPGRRAHSGAGAGRGVVSAPATLRQKRPVGTTAGPPSSQAALAAGRTGRGGKWLPAGSQGYGRLPAALPARRQRSQGSVCGLQATGRLADPAPALRPVPECFASPHLSSPRLRSFPPTPALRYLCPPPLRWPRSRFPPATAGAPEGPSPGGLGLRWCGAKRPALELGFSRSTASFPLIPGR